MGEDEPIELRWASRSRRRRRRMITQTRMPAATMARNPSTTITAIAQCGKGGLPLFCWMVGDGVEVWDAKDATDALDASEATEAAERDDCAERVEREDCDMEEATESAYVVSGVETIRSQGIGYMDRTYELR